MARSEQPPNQLTHISAGELSMKPNQKAIEVGRFDATHIGVTVHSGVATLTGFVRRYAQKTQAEVDAKRVRRPSVRLGRRRE